MEMTDSGANEKLSFINIFETKSLIHGLSLSFHFGQVFYYEVVFNFFSDTF